MLCDIKDQPIDHKLWRGKWENKVNQPLRSRVLLWIPTQTEQKTNELQSSLVSEQWRSIVNFDTELSRLRKSLVAMLND